jgi:hypothetical protein
MSQIVADLSSIVAHKEASELRGVYLGRHTFKSKITGAVGA